MPFDPSGVYSREHDWEQDAANNVKILASLHEDNDDDFETALSLCLCRDGRSTVSANMPWSGKKITNLGDPVDPQDAATLRSVQALRSFATSLTIEGADANGRLTFSGTGTNGIQWTGPADLSWLAKPAKASETSNRLVMNDKGDGTGTDRFIIDEAGRLNNAGILTNNLSYDGAAWRTISPGYGSELLYTGGDFKLLSNDTASTTSPYKAVTLREFFGALNSIGSSLITMTKSASGKYCSLRGMVGPELRWQMQLGDATAEGSDNAGSNFVLTAYDNNGAALEGAMHIYRSDRRLTVYGTAYKPGGGQWSDSSDARIKEVHGDYETGLDAVLALRPVRYHFKGNDSDEAGNRHSDDRERVGLVAQEAEAVMPSLVTLTKGTIDGVEVDDLRALDPSELIYTLVNCIKQLTARIETLEAKA